MKKYLKNNKGFSLIELVTVIVVLGIITVPITRTLIAYRMGYNTQVTQTVNRDVVNVALSRVISDIRERQADAVAYYQNAENASAIKQKYNAEVVCSPASIGKPLYEVKVKSLDGKYEAVNYCTVGV